MGVYIRGMEMPKSCLQGECPIDGEFCTLWTEEHWKSPDEPYRKRHPKCPLVPVPPHGRLIDADVLIDYCKHFAEVFKNSSLPIDKARRDELLGVIGEIVNTPTIIEEEVYSQYTDTAGNYHWFGTHSGEHVIKAEDGE